MSNLEKIATQKIAKRYRALGTVIDLAAYGTAREQDLDDAFALIKYYEDLLTVNRELSALMEVNHAAGQHPVSVPDAVYQLTKIAVQTSQEHFGFNAAIGPLVKLWHIGFADAHLPEPDEIEVRRQLVSPDKIELDDDSFSIYLPQAGMELDLGGIAKGYIADRVKDFWRARGISSGIINLGGNLVLMGKAPHQPDKKWRVGIRNPLNQTGETIAQIKTGASSVVTSGIAERHFEIDGKSYHHIIDPETGYPHDNQIASVTVLTPESIDGEIETTRLFFADEPPTNYAYQAIYVYRDKSMLAVNLDDENIKITNSEFYWRK